MNLPLLSVQCITWLGWDGLGLGWTGLGWAGLGWAGLGWAGLGWAGLAGLGWAGLGLAGLGLQEDASKDSLEAAIEMDPELPGVRGRSTPLEMTILGR